MGRTHIPTVKKRVLQTSRQVSVVLLIIGIASMAVSFNGCFRSNQGCPETGGPMANKTIEQVLKDSADKWMALPSVVGVAIGQFQDKPCIKIFTSSDPKELRDKISSTVEGYPVIIERTGEFHALN
jgi:hypothetical protein